MNEPKIIQIIPAPAGMSIVSEFGDSVFEIPAAAIALVEEDGTRYLSALGMNMDGETFSSTDPNFMTLLFNGDHIREDAAPTSDEALH